MTDEQEQETEEEKRERIRIAALATMAIQRKVHPEFYAKQDEERSEAQRLEQERIESEEREAYQIEESETMEARLSELEKTLSELKKSITFTLFDDEGFHYAVCFYEETIVWLKKKKLSGRRLQAFLYSCWKLRPAKGGFRTSLVTRRYKEGVVFSLKEFESLFLELYEFLSEKDLENLPISSFTLINHLKHIKKFEEFAKASSPEERKRILVEYKPKKETFWKVDRVEIIDGKRHGILKEVSKEEFEKI